MRCKAKVESKWKKNPLRDCYNSAVYGDYCHTHRSLNKEPIPNSMTERIIFDLKKKLQEKGSKIGDLKKAIAILEAEFKELQVLYDKLAS